MSRLLLSVAVVLAGRALLPPGPAAEKLAHDELHALGLQRLATLADEERASSIAGRTFIDAVSACRTSLLYCLPSCSRWRTERLVRFQRKRSRRGSTPRRGGLITTPCL
jgi:hypothetical protein